MIKLKGGTASAMSAENPVLADRQPGFARTDNGGILKIGDGVTPWNDLSEIGVGPGKRTVRLTVGTSATGWTALDCDYLCDGTDDQIEINAAIQALPATGGEIVILDGTYNITATIAMNKDNVKLSGNGNATVLKRMWDSLATEGIITVTTTKGGCCIENLFVDGDQENFPEPDNFGICLYSSSSNTITGNTCYNNSSNGIYLYSSSNNNTITGNTCSGNYDGIYLYDSNNNTITGNTCNNNNSYGINLSGSSNTITGNTCNGNNDSGIYLSSNNNNTITGNTCNDNSNNGIALYGSSSNTITGNTCNGNDSGIYLYDSNNNTITGNTCNGNNDSGIYLNSNNNNNTITGNTCNGNNDSGIYLNSNNNNNTITGNTCIRGTGQSSDYTTSQFTIHIGRSSSKYNLIAYNNIMGKDVVIIGGSSNTSEGNKYS